MSLASRGTRETDGGTEPVADAALADALRKKARVVYVKTALATAAIGFVFYLLR